MAHKHKRCFEALLANSWEKKQKTFCLRCQAYLFDCSDASIYLCLKVYTILQDGGNLV